MNTHFYTIFYLEKANSRGTISPRLIHSIFIVVLAVFLDGPLLGSL